MTKVLFFLAGIVGALYLGFAFILVVIAFFAIWTIGALIYDFLL